MRNLLQRSLTTAVSGTIAAGCAWILDQYVLEEHAVLGASLAIYGVLEKLFGDFWLATTTRQDLSESLKLFFENLSRQANLAPLWAELGRQVSASITVETSETKREILRNALAEIQGLQTHVSFIALKEDQVQALNQLRKSIQRRGLHV